MTIPHSPNVFSKRTSLRGRSVFLMVGLLLCFTVITVPVELSAQAVTPTEWDAQREQMTRAELEALLSRLEIETQSSAYSNALREQASRSAELVRTRLEEGDFQVGDRIVLEVEQEPEMSDTLAVRAGRVVDVPVVGQVSLEGVLRSELDEHMTDFMGQFIRDPVVRTESLVRVLVQGAVGQPNFYLVPADRLVTDVITTAGGPTGEADLDRMRVERGQQRIWEGQALQDAIVQGRTLDQMNLQSGDRLMIPVDEQRSTWEVVRNVTGVVGTLATLTYALTRIF